MSVLRKNKVSDYTIIDNNVFKNKQLSLKAKGLLCEMLSLPDDWEYSLNGLVTLSDDGITTIRTALKELEDQKYFSRHRLYENGKLAGVEYVISETPMLENLILENLNYENQPQLNTNIINKENNKIYRQIVDAWNAICTRKKPVSRVTMAMRKKLDARLKTYTYQDLVGIFGKVQDSDFLCGWQGCNFDWVIKNEENIRKIDDGNYANKSKYTKTEQELMDAYNKIGGGMNERPFGVD